MRCLSPELSYSEDYSINYDQAEEEGAQIHKKTESWVDSRNAQIK